MLDEENVASDAEYLDRYRQQVDAVSRDQYDPWLALGGFAYSRAPSLLQPSIIHAEHECVTLYLKNIDTLWELAIKRRREGLRAEVGTSLARVNRRDDGDPADAQGTVE